MKRVAVVVLLLLGGLPGRANGQLLAPLESFFRRVDGLTVFASVGDLTSAHDLKTQDFLGVNALRGMGLEVIIDLVPEAADSGLWDLELALGADYQTGFAALDPTLDLRGSVRGLPTFSIYVTPPLEWHALSPYLGVNLGFVQLWNVQAYDPDGVQYDVDGDTFQMGLALGIYHNSGFFVEAAYRNRNFRSLHWGLPSGVLPAGWPRSVDLSALLVSVGYQFGRLLEKKEQAEGG